MTRVACSGCQARERLLKVLQQCGVSLEAWEANKENYNSLEYAPAHRKIEKRTRPAMPFTPWKNRIRNRN